MADWSLIALDPAQIAAGELEKIRAEFARYFLLHDPGPDMAVFTRRAKSGDAQARAQRISDYLINSRGLDTHRVVIVMGPQREDWLFELWVVPEGAPPPTPNR